MLNIQKKNKNLYHEEQGTIYYNVKNTKTYIINN